ncbi:hypothetical protein [Pseudoroseomonas cervicalis]|uniref:hypothetical protein n=1 Tax=Teichococcus cervicalis TaxID=204525 RepID=UPI0022F1B374|nr:hypothetical protein [Pseudoroseomonas cervicalis]WBV44986.1 hypothetical protein PFY06_17930 [Pseudoroseomonas cervicalis]
MAAASLGLRPLLVEQLGLQPAVYVANGFGLLLGAALNLVLARWLSSRPEDEGQHSFLGLGMLGWSVLALLGGAAMVVYGLLLAG